MPSRQKLRAPTNVIIRCSECGKELEHVAGAADTPCGNCGSSLRTIEVSLKEKMDPRFGHRLKLKDPNSTVRKKIILEASTSYEPSEIARKVKKDRVIDRLNDSYYERVVNMISGEVIRECREPLSEHRGRGSKKRK
jgi:hypothetical protein